MTRTIWTISAAAALFSFSLAPPVAAQNYAITDLGTLGGNQPTAFAISAAGQVAGTDSASGYGRAFRWSPTAPNGAAGFMAALAPPKGYTATGGYNQMGINTSGQVAGTSYGNKAPYGVGALWNADGSAQILTSGSGQSVAVDVNDSGQATGWWVTSGGTHFWLSTVVNGKRSFFDLGSGLANGINASGQITGQAHFSRNDGWIWTPTKPNGTSGAFTQLPAFAPGSNNYPSRINDYGQVAGDSSVPDGSGNWFSRAYLWLPSAAYGLPAGLNNLGILPGGYNSSAAALNRVGVVVGWADLGGAQDPNHAFVWDSVNGIRDLNDLIPAGSGWVLAAATGVNDAGQIVANGTLNGVQRACLLTPQP